MGPWRLVGPPYRRFPGRRPLSPLRYWSSRAGSTGHDAYANSPALRARPRSTLRRATRACSTPDGDVHTTAHEHADAASHGDTAPNRNAAPAPHQDAHTPWDGDAHHTAHPNTDSSVCGGSHASPPSYHNTAHRHP